MKTLIALYDDRFLAWNAITEISRNHIVPRHEMEIAAVHSDHPDGRTRVIVKTKLPHEAKDALTVLKKYGPIELTNDKGKAIKR